MYNSQISAYIGEEDNIMLKEMEKSREFRKKAIVGDILWSIHQKQGTQACLIQAIEPYLEKGDRLLFGLI